MSKAEDLAAIAEEGNGFSSQGLQSVAAELRRLDAENTALLAANNDCVAHYDELRAELAAAKDALASVANHGAELDAVRKDAERLNWIERKLFTQKWNGVVGSGCVTQWSIAPNYRHTILLIKTDDIEIDFRSAIDAAMEKTNG